MRLLRSLTIFLAVLSASESLPPIKLISNFFESKFLQVGSVFTCSPKRDEILAAKKLKLRLSFFNLNERNVAIGNDRSRSNVGMVLDGDCENATSLLKSCERKRLFQDGRHWLITSTRSYTAVLNDLERVELSLNADVNVVVGSGENRTVLDVYNPSYAHGGELKIRNVGYYNEMQGYQISGGDGHVYENRRNMTGTVLKAMVVLAYPFNATLREYLTGDVNRSVDSNNRFAHVVLQHCRDFYNFTMKTVMTKSWGYRASNKTPFDGLVGALQRKKADLGTCIFFKKERLPFIDYSRRVWFLRTAFVFRMPKQKTSLSKFAETLSASVWTLVIFLTLAVVVLFKLVLAAERKILRELRENTWSFLALVTIGVLCQQGTPRTPFLSCGRILLLTIFLFSMLLYQFYSGTIVSYLLMAPSATIKSLGDLLKSDMHVGCEDVLYNKDFFRQTTDPVIRKLYLTKMVKKRNLTNYMPPEEGLRKVRGGNFAYHVDLTTAYEIIEETFSNEQICELGEVRMLNYQDMYVSLQKGSPFRKAINFCVQKMTETGLLRRGFNFWQSRRPMCLRKTFNAMPIGLNEFYPALVLLAAAICLSVTVLVAEIIAHRNVK